MKIIAGNFKSNKTREQSRIYLQRLEAMLFNKQGVGFEVYIFPATSSLLYNNYRNITLGAQNCHYVRSGAYTGEITLEHLEEFNIKSILIGHSERRGLFGENDKECAKKFDFFKNEGFRIFYCVGENEEVRDNGTYKDFITSQLSYISLDYDNLVIAYEPIWAIGTGRNATLDQIDEIYSFLKTKSKAPILYGGSVNENNAKDILSIVDGILVGSASLDIEKFSKML